MTTTRAGGADHDRQQWGRRPAPVLVDFAAAYLVPDSPLYGGQGRVAARDAAMGADTVVMGGLMTSGRVRASVVDSMSHGFVTLLVADACGDRAAEPHRADPYDMSAEYADVIAPAEALDYLARAGKG